MTEPLLLLLSTNGGEGVLWSYCPCACHKDQSSDVNMNISHRFPCCLGACLHCKQHIIGNMDAHVLERHPSAVEK
jgi:hypothetical protein